VRDCSHCPVTHSLAHHTLETCDHASAMQKVKTQCCFDQKTDFRNLMPINHGLVQEGGVKNLMSNKNDAKNLMLINRIRLREGVLRGVENLMQQNLMLFNYQKR
jgi:hypothetical protein